MPHLSKAARLSLLVLMTPLAAVGVVAGAARADGAPGWGWPLPPPHRVVHPFAPPAHDWLPGHRGVDLGAEPGEPVVAAGAGRVAFAGVVAGKGVVGIRHPDGLETTYEPVLPAVRAGAEVAAGAVIGHVAAEGSHCAPRPCLHWGLRRGDSYLDPLGLVGAARVRLLPMFTDIPRRSWVAPAAGGASVGSSAVVVGWAVTVARRRRRRLPAGVTSITDARIRRAARAGSRDADARA